MENLPSSIRIGTSASGHSTGEKFFAQMLHESGELDPRPNLYGSDAGYCPRKNFLYASQPDQFSSISATGQIYMGIGNGVEAVLSDSLDKRGRLFFNNLYLPPMDPVVRGKIDLVYLDEDDDIAIGELKTCGELPSEPKPNHYAQLATYAAVAGYDKTNLIYISRNVADYSRGNPPRLLIKVFPIKFSNEQHAETLKKIVFSKMAIDQNFLPPIPYDFSKSRSCGFCPFKDECWTNPDFGIEELEEDELLEKLEEAEDLAWKLTIERETRLIASLRHLYRNIDDRKLKLRLIEEIEKYEEF